MHVHVDNLLTAAAATPRFASFAHSSAKSTSSGGSIGRRRHTDPSKTGNSQLLETPVSGVSRPSTLFLRSNQQQNMAKGMAVRFDLDISISSGECVLHADAPFGLESKIIILFSMGKMDKFH